MARPKKNINKKAFENLCGIQCTEKEICSVLDATDKTLTRWCKDTYKKSFSEVYREKKCLGATSIRRNQWKLAEAGNVTMLIWLGKQILAQSESPTLDNIKLKELELKIKEFELKEKLILKQLEGDEKSSSEIAATLRDIFGDDKKNENNT